MEFLPYSRQLVEQDDIDAVVETLKSTHLTQGRKTIEFEEKLAKYIGCRYVAVLNSATSSLFATYRAFDFRERDEVITTPISFVATSNMVIECRAKPIFVDTKFDGNIDIDKIEAKITDRTRAIVSVDISGNPVDAKRVQAICKKYNLKFISDSSHALGSEIAGVRVGNFADSTIFSFHAIKPITTFEGGAVATNDEELIEKVKLIRSHGVVKKELWSSDMVELGHNLRLSDVASSIGITQLSKLDNFIAKRDEIAKFYDEQFKNNPYFTTLKRLENSKSSHHLYPILLDRTLYCPKEDIFKALIEEGIGVQVHYKPIHTNSFYKKLYGEQSFPTAEDFYRAELSIPCNQAMDLNDAKRVVETLFKVLEKYKDRCRF